MAKPTKLAQLIADAQTRKHQAGSPSAPLSLVWFFELHFADPPEWYRDHARLELLADRVAALPWFAELDTLGRNSAYGEPLGGPGDLRDALICDDRVTVTLARGGARAAQWTNEAELALVLIVAPTRLELHLTFAEAALRRHGRAAIDEVLALAFEVHAAWQPQARLRRGAAFPAPETIAYRRARPPRLASRALGALVDVVDPGASEESRAIAEAEAPPDVQRIERGGLVALRWIDDPSDRAAVEEACSRHEQWIVQVIETQVVQGWNADGDLRVQVLERDPDPGPLTVLDAGRGGGYLFVDVDPAGGLEGESGEGGEGEARWEQAARIARARALPDRRGVEEVAVVAQDRAAALRIEKRARSSGFSRVLYRTSDGAFWDPFPPGLWIEPVIPPVKHDPR